MCINILTITIKITTCPRGEIGRHKGLKILALLGVPVRGLAEGTIMKMNKLLIISDKNSKSLKIKKQIIKILKKKNLKKKYNNRYWWRWIYAPNLKKKIKDQKNHFMG